MVSLSFQKYCALSFAKSGARIGSLEYKHWLSKARESALKIGVPLAHSVEDRVNDIYREEGIPNAVESILKRAELSRRFGGYDLVSRDQREAVRLAAEKNSWGPITIFFKRIKVAITGNFNY